MICRMAYNNALKAEQNNLIKNINNALNKNRRILEGIIATDKSKATKQELTKTGFKFEYHTHNRENKNGGVYYYC